MLGFVYIVATVAEARPTPLPLYCLFLSFCHLASEACANAAHPASQRLPSDSMIARIPLSFCFYIVIFVLILCIIKLRKTHAAPDLHQMAMIQLLGAGYIKTISMARDTGEMGNET